MAKNHPGLLTIQTGLEKIGRDLSNHKADPDYENVAFYVARAEAAVLAAVHQIDTALDILLDTAALTAQETPIAPI